MSNFYTNVFRYGNSIYLRGYDDNGNRVQKKIRYQPYLFVSHNDPNSQYRDIHDNPVKRLNFESMNEAKEFLSDYKEISGINVYGYDRWEYMFIYDQYKFMKPDTSKINIVGLDIEVASDDGFPQPEEASKKVTAITLMKKDLTIVLGCGDFVSNDENIKYIRCDNERDLLIRFLKQWENLDIDVLTGWNTEFFDIPYLVHRITNLLGADDAKRLSPWKMLRSQTMTMGTKQLMSYDLQGISCLDYLAVYKKFQLAPRESYRLDFIAETEIGEKKIDYSEHGNLFTLYRDDYQKFIEYNIRDVELIFRLEERLGYLEQIFALTYDSRVNHHDALSSLTIWDTIIHKYLLDQNIVIPSKKSDLNNLPQIEGGFVKSPIVGMHEWVMSFDLNSLYPHLMMQFNISPDTRVPDEEIMNARDLAHCRKCTLEDLIQKNVDMSALQKYDFTMTANKKFYRRDKRGFLAELMNKMYIDRKKFKNRMLEAKQQYENDPSRDLEIEISRCSNMQMALKILLNSAYGALANRYFRWFENDNAEAITVSGQLAIRWIEKKINEYMNKILKTENHDYVLAVDTDSVYICFERLVNQVYGDNLPDKNKVVDFLNKVASEKLEPFIEKSYLELYEYLNAYEQKMVMKRENIGDKAIWTAKKRYIMNVYDSEGVRYAEPKLKMMGIEAIRSSTPKVCRDYIINTLKLIMTGNEKDVQKYISEIRKEFQTLSFEQIAFPRGVNLTTKINENGKTYNRPYADKNTIYRKATPIHVKGSLIYNHYLKEKNLNKKYEEIKDGEKIKFCYLKVPNPFRDKVIACPDTLPSEFGLEKYIDYDMQFEKGYLAPIEIILNTIGWSAEKQMSLEGFFS